MGKKHKRHRVDNRKKQAGDERDDENNSNFTNALFEAYYKAQNLMSESEWDECVGYLRKPLPTTFRISGSRAGGEVLNQLVKDTHIPSLRDAEIPSELVGEDGEEVKGLTQLPWYPGGLAWQFIAPKKVLRKVKEFKKFHEFLIYETDVGNISRQEAVSMIPPLYLRVVPGDIVLDTCAAPGSKTAQLLEALHAPPDPSSPSGPGLLIANDSDLKRTHLLIHQSARVPSDKFMVTNLDASSYPGLNIGVDSSGRDMDRTRKLRFTKILCDVPCSGDGTMRKNPGIWRKWNVANGNGLHSLQLRILRRAMGMLTYGSEERIVYSTCSMNPIENEAVIAAALRANEGFELEDVSNLHPSLISRPGVSSWYPHPSSWRDPTTPLFSWKSWQHYLDDRAKSAKEHGGAKGSEAIKVRDKLLKSMFPPEDVESLHLERCLRLYPHLMDTGGFFVAVLKRKATPQEVRSTQRGDQVLDSKMEDITAKSIISSDVTSSKRPISPTTAVDTESGHSPVKRLKADDLDVAMGDQDVQDEPATSAFDMTADVEAADPEQSLVTPVNEGAFKEPPFTFLPESHPHVVRVKQTVDLSPHFPFNNLFIHAACPPDVALDDIPVRTLYLANSIVKSVITHNDFARIRIVSAGTKVLSKQEVDGVQFRIMDEGLEAILPYVNEGSVVAADLDDLKPMLKEYYPFLGKFKEGNFRAAVESHDVGNIMARFVASDDGSPRRQHPLTLALWKSKVSICLMVNKKSKSALSLRLFGQDLTLAIPKPSKSEADIVAVDPVEQRVLSGSTE